MTPRLSLLAKCAPALALCVLPFAVIAQENYPTKPVRIIVPFSAGGVAGTSSVGCSSIWRRSIAIPRTRPCSPTCC